MAGCCDLLREDHRRTGILLSELSGLLLAGDRSAFEQGFNTLCEELLRHYVLEERALFPVLSMYRPMILMEVEHEDLQMAEHAVRAAMAAGDSKKLLATFDFFDERLRAHIVEEDEGIFRMAETLPEPEEQALVSRKMIEVSQQLLAEPNLYLKRNTPALEIRQSPLFQVANRPIAMNTLFEAEHDSLQLVRLKAGQSLSPHWAAQYQCLLVLSGKLALTADGQTHPLQAGDQVNIEPRLLFSLSVSENASEEAALLAFKIWPKPNYLRS